MAMPASYTGDTACGGFLLQVVLYIEMQPQKFSSKRAKVAFLISLLKGKALLWEKAIWNADSAIINSYDAFMNHFKEVFGQSTGTLFVSDQLLQLHQGSSSISDYTLQFRMLAGTSWWNETALLSAYRQGSDPRIRAQMAIYEDSIGLESFMSSSVPEMPCPGALS